jgi:hypothetical protein
MCRCLLRHCLNFDVLLSFSILFRFKLFCAEFNWPGARDSAGIHEIDSNATSKAGASRKPNA